MLTESMRGPMTCMTLWAGQDGPVVLTEGLIGIEFSGRIGHPSSYGLIIGGLAADKSGALINSTLNDEIAGVIAVNGDRFFDGMAEPEYAAAIVASAQELGLRIAAVVAGEMSSSRLIFRRLAKVLSAALNNPGRILADDQIWDVWDNAK